MKKLIYAALSLLVIGIFAGSCTKGAEDYLADLAGKWQVYKVLDYDGNTRTQTSNDVFVFMTFTEAGECIYEEMDADGYVDEVRTNFRIENGSVVMGEGEYIESWKIEKLTKTELVFKVMDGDIMKMYLKRVE